jgi:hypothetical protein
MLDMTSSLVQADEPKAGTGTVSVTVREAGGDTLLPCRAWVNVSDKRFFKPATPECTPYDRDKSFTCNGRFTIDLPVGKAVVHVERGKEYVPIDQAVTVEPGRAAEVKIDLRRWTSMADQGWYSADLHAHFIQEDRRILKTTRFADDLRVLKQLALADDVNWLPAFSYWNDWNEGWPSWPEGPSVRADARHLVTLNNEEIERIAPADGEAFTSLGAPLLFGLTRPVYVPRHDSTYPCDAVLCRMAKKTSPDCVIDTDKALWAENVVGVALGLFDCVQLCHNHYHRDKTFRMGWGMIGPDLEEGKKDWGTSEMLMRTDEIYYRWLNCGFRLAASGGSAIGVMPVPLGYSRTYAKVDGPLSEASLLKAIRAGRTFATTGPMLMLTVNGQDCGATIDWASKGGEPLQVKAVLRSIQPIECAQLISDGEVIQESRLADQAVSPVLESALNAKLEPRRSGWVAARALFKCADGSLHQAHTSPVYITVDKKPTAYKKDAEYMIRWIDRILEISARPQRYASEQDRSEVQAVYREARGVYEKIGRTATEVWKD